MSCAGCHQPEFYGTFPAAFCFGVRRRKCNRNVPTPLNAAVEFANNWTANRRNVEVQASEAMTIPIGSGLDDKSVVDRVKQISGYAPLSREAFPGAPDPVTRANMGTAVRAWKRTLLTPSPFDAFLDGKIDSLNLQARRGLGKFMSAGCIGCHNGVGIGGGSVQKFGVVEEYWKATQSKNIDHGRAAATKRAEDEYMFKVPMLRNVAQTPPYFHDGSADTLPEAVAIMARVQIGLTLQLRFWFLMFFASLNQGRGPAFLILGSHFEPIHRSMRRYQTCQTPRATVMLSLSEADRNDIVAFLESLTGERPAEFRTIPILPQNAVQIPK